MYDSSVGEHNSNNYGLLWFMVRKELLVFLGLRNQLITFGAPTLYGSKPMKFQYLEESTSMSQLSWGTLWAPGF